MSSHDQTADSLDVVSHDTLPSATPLFLRERFGLRVSPAAPEHSAAAEAAAEPFFPGDRTSDRASLDAELEQAVYAALRQARQPEPAPSLGFLAELDQRLAAISAGRRVSAAIGVSAIIALFFVFIVPASHEFAAQNDPAPTANLQSMKAALNEPLPVVEETKAGLCELQSVLGPPESQPAATHEQSENLLQQFMQWRQKPIDQKTP
jgi:hypothetical protein